MKKNANIYFSFFFVLQFFIGCKGREVKELISNSPREETLEHIDGPYVYTETDSLTIITVEKNRDSSYYIENKKIQKSINQEIVCKVDNLDKDHFSVILMDEYRIPESIYSSQDRVFVTSDIEGNFNAFYSLLVGNKIMSKDFNWTFGNGHLVIAGDMVDRGNNVMPCLWLLYKLEQDAKINGGQVHYILGNHDVMNMQLNLKYVQPKYIQLAKILSNKENDQEAYKHLMSNTNELVKWIKSKNTIEKIGNSLFLHGGISEDLVDTGLSIQEINDYVRKYIDNDLYGNPGNDEYANLIFGPMGPLWYRGLVKDHKKYYKKIDSNSLDDILRFYNVEHIIIGHTIIDDQVTADFKGKVIRVDIKHSNKKFTGKSQALLIENNFFYRVNDRGDKVALGIVN